jgi:hypothetical protein
MTTSNALLGIVVDILDVSVCFQDCLSSHAKRKKNNNVKIMMKEKKINNVKIMLSKIEFICLKTDINNNVKILVGWLKRCFLLLLLLLLL